VPAALSSAKPRSDVMWSLVASETGIRLLTFAAVFAGLAYWEIFAPRRELQIHKSPRWASNLALVTINTLVIRIVAPLGAVGVALFAEDRGWGLFQNAALPAWAAIAASVILLDLAIYLQHVMFHAVPLLWRLHMVHHADLDFDVTTGLRFHSLEILLSLGIKALVILLIGPPAAAVVIFEVLLNSTSMFNHSNVRMPPFFDRALRWIVVTPDMHRVHHSVHTCETNSNFGFNLPWWDRLLGTYRDQPGEGHERMTIGLAALRDEHQVDRIGGMLQLPFNRSSVPGKLKANPETAKERGTGTICSEDSAKLYQSPAVLRGQPAPHE
jgi:sterol desaturase/sphingolipid hydroxylase (fatty acid hydroxylase superfamily)